MVHMKWILYLEFAGILTIFGNHDFPAQWFKNIGNDNKKLKENVSGKKNGMKTPKLRSDTLITFFQTSASTTRNTKQPLKETEPELLKMSTGNEDFTTIVPHLRSTKFILNVTASQDESTILTDKINKVYWEITHITGLTQTTIHHMHVTIDKESSTCEVIVTSNLPFVSFTTTPALSTNTIDISYLPNEKTTEVAVSEMSAAVSSSTTVHHVIITIRKKKQTTMVDNRPTAVGLGTMGVIILLAFLVCFVVLDSTTLYRDVKLLKRRLYKYFRPFQDRRWKLPQKIQPKPELSSSNEPTTWSTDFIIEKM